MIKSIKIVRTYQLLKLFIITNSFTIKTTLFVYFCFKKNKTQKLVWRTQICIQILIIWIMIHLVMIKMSF